ncbi:xanthine dehydrogenase family protein molybdopterin-binding subunit [Algihabitans albus]|uniref:xanthine dehydrogenase family protein molybdopterin-binding subunit n=1 Tax=Algihabitans albus TaxID=2164067 RepID=UPI000E5D8A7A|nr:xanthine dehydrogenase family protein molybdopterin-binding subunit [Algihabitans albus]
MTSFAQKRSPSDRLSDHPSDPDPASDRNALAAGGFGVPLCRVEDVRLVTGGGCYVADLTEPTALHLVFARSPLARARIAELDVRVAAAQPGVVAVLTGEDLTGLPPLETNPVLGPMAVPAVHPLAIDEVHAVGHAFAAVVAETEDLAQSAAELIEVDFEPLEPVSDLLAALDAGPLFAGMESNVAIDRQWRSGKPEDAFAMAHSVVDVELQHPKVAPSPLENRATLARWDAATECLIFCTGSQTPHRARADLARILGLESGRVHAVSPDVGGAFGMKASIYPEDVVVAYAARTLGRSVRWSAERGEDLAAASHGRGASTRGRMAFDASGRILGLTADLLFPLGCWMTYSAAVPAWNAARILPGPYAIEALEVRVRAVVSNTAPVGIYRGAGRPEAALLLERLLDEGAFALGQDPADLRRRNLLKPHDLPVVRPGGARLDGGDFPELLDRALAQAGYRCLLNRRQVRRARGELVGLGLGLYVEPCGQGWESAAVTLDLKGGLSVASGSSAQGQGRQTAYAQILARELAVSPDAVRVVFGDTRTAPEGIGALASRSTAIGGSAVQQAGRRLIARARPLAARLLNAAPDSVTFGSAGFTAETGVRRPIGWDEIAAELDEPLVADCVYTADAEAWGAGCCLALVSVDRDTGCVSPERLWYLDDAGTVVNPLLVDGQIAGGIAQGIGEALLERVCYDSDGQLLSGSLMDYALPRASDMPSFDLARMTTPSPSNTLGAKGVGEAGTIGAPPAILNAVIDALSPLGVRRLDMPLTSERVWQAMRSAERDTPREERGR